MAAERVLVIVESPAKAKTIEGYLNGGSRDFTVKASVGHVRDLASKASELPESLRKQPWAKYAVNTDEGFAPFYVVHANKKATIAELKKELAGASELLLATDEDREGEAIAWHLLEVLKPKVPVRRMVFHEITKHAISDALEQTRELDMRLVDAQETRRIVDRLYGYPVSEVLWKKIGRDARSAGRVQSVAVRLVVDRERERIAFVSASYWDLTATFDPGSFAARLNSVEGKRLATGRDFDDRGQLTGRDCIVLDETGTQALAAALEGVDYTVRSVVEKPGKRSPKAPFMTSTLQQESSRRFRWNAQRTMRVAQGLYERGYITYMRTDSTTLSEQAVTAARAQAAQLYGHDHVADAPRRYDRKVKNAQEAHEAIRPSGDTFRTPGEVQRELSADEFALYDLIWKRTLASQMADARVATTTVTIGAVASDGRDVEFTASGTVTLFAGFKAAYEDTREEDSDDESERVLPVLREGQSLTATDMTADGHSTNPPARFTEASLTAKLEELGIGRPSTYAAIMGTIVDRGYVWKKGSALIPSFLAFAVIRLLEEHFSELVDYRFTARMEEYLDAIANGDSERGAQLETFWRGGDTDTGPFRGVLDLTTDLGAIDARMLSTFPIEGTDAVVRVGRYGAFVERGEERASIPDDLAPDELTAEKAEELLAQPSGERDLGVDPETGLAIIARAGRYGPYVSEVLPEDSPKSAKPRTGSLLKSMSLDTVTLEDALRLISLPRVVGVDPADGVEITAQNGRYGPYLMKGKDSRSLPNEESIFTVTLDEALALYAQPKQRRGAASAPPLKELGEDPVSGKPVVLKEGRFGPYVTDGETNASLRRDDDPETIDPGRAYELLADRRARGPVKRTAKKAAKKAPAKKAAKKAAAKKAPAKKSAKKAPAKKAAKSCPRPHHGGAHGPAAAGRRLATRRLRSVTAARFIVFEGGEGAGKSTQSRALADYLEARGHRVRRTREPGGTPAAEAIRAVLLDPANTGLDDRAEALLFAAARGDHAARVIRPALEEGEIVISDRYLDSSVAYQGVARDLGAERVADLSLWATGGLVPDLTIVLDVDPSVGLARVVGPDRLEAEPVEWHRRVRQAFLDIAAAAPDRYLVLDGSRPVEDLAVEIASTVSDLVGDP